MESRFDKLREKILVFRHDRDWQQFHDPKNLAEGLVIESAELLENFLWKRCSESRSLDAAERGRIADELADIFIFLVYLSEEFELDLLEESERKLELNGKKYPVEKSRGSRKKYNRL